MLAMMLSACQSDTTWIDVANNGMIVIAVAIVLGAWFKWGRR